MKDVPTEALDAVDTTDALLLSPDTGDAEVGVGSVGNEGDEMVGVADSEVGSGEKDRVDGGGTTEIEDMLSEGAGEGRYSGTGSGERTGAGIGVRVGTGVGERVGTGVGELARTGEGERAGTGGTETLGACVDETVDMLSLSLSVMGGIGDGVERLPGPGGRVDIYDVGDALGLSTVVSNEMSGPSGMATDSMDGEARSTEDSYVSSVSGAHSDSRTDGLWIDIGRLDGVVGAGVTSSTRVGVTDDSVTILGVLSNGVVGTGTVSVVDHSVVGPNVESESSGMKGLSETLETSEKLSARSVDTGSGISSGCTDTSSGMVITSLGARLTVSESTGHRHSAVSNSVEASSSEHSSAVMNSVEHNVAVLHSVVGAPAVEYSVEAAGAVENSVEADIAVS